MGTIDLSKLVHALWKQKCLYERALELTEKSIMNIEYIPALNEVLKDIKETNKELVIEKIREL